MIDKYNNYNILPLLRLPFQGRSSFPNNVCGWILLATNEEFFPSSASPSRGGAVSK